MENENLICQYCGKLCKINFGLTLHEKSCKLNPNRVYKIRSKSYAKTICDKCGRKITNCNFEKHYKKCDGKLHTRYELDHDDLFCKWCQKEFLNKNSLVQHEIRCKENPERLVTLVCMNGVNAMNAKNKLVGVWNKGQTKETNSSIAKQAETYKSNLLSGKIHLLYGDKNPAKREEVRQKIGETISNNFVTGKQITSPESGHGLKSYVILNNKKFLLRSFYEFLYALYLHEQGVKFLVEDIHVQAAYKNMYRKSFISDFSYDNTVIEVKGFYTDKDIVEKDSFEKAGYTFNIIYGKQIDTEIKPYLIKIGYNINELKSKIKLGNQTKEYFIYDFDK